MGYGALLIAFARSIADIDHSVKLGTSLWGLFSRMFGLGKVDGLKRRKYNSRVKWLLENRIGIETDSFKNPDFPGIIIFAHMLDEGWYQNLCPEDNALYIALRYWSGCAKAGGDPLTEARRIDKPITDFLMEVGMSGKVPEARCRQFVMFYDDNRWPLSASAAEQPPQDRERESAVSKCPSCSQSVRVAAGKNLKIKCPKCGRLWVQRT